MFTWMKKTRKKLVVIKLKVKNADDRRVLLGSLQLEVFGHNQDGILAWRYH
jgi:hypothetical protein